MNKFNTANKSKSVIEFIYSNIAAYFSYTFGNPRLGEGVFYFFIRPTVSLSQSVPKQDKIIKLFVSLSQLVKNSYLAIRVGGGESTEMGTKVS